MCSRLDAFWIDFGHAVQLCRGAEYVRLFSSTRLLREQFFMIGGWKQWVGNTHLLCYIYIHIHTIFTLSWETSTQENLAPEASDRPETRLELLTRTCSIRFVFPLSRLEPN